MRSCAGVEAWQKSGRRLEVSTKRRVQVGPPASNRGRRRRRRDRRRRRRRRWDGPRRRRRRRWDRAATQAAVEEENGEVDLKTNFQ